MNGCARRLVLHIGTQKTGTSAVQKWFNENQQQLLKSGYYYPLTGQWSDNSHHRWAIALWDAIRASEPTALHKLISDLATELRSAGLGENAIILSSEIFEKLPIHAKGRKILEELFDTLDVDVEVVAFLRRQDLLIESWFKQWVKDVNRRISVPPERFIGEQSRFLDYNELLSMWRSLPRVRDLKIATNALMHNPIDEMERLLDLDIVDRKGNRFEVVNASLDGEALRLKYFVNRFPLTPEEDLEVLSCIDRMDISRERLNLFSDEERATFVGRFAQSNALLAKTYRVDNFETPASGRPVPRFSAELDEVARNNLLRLGSVNLRFAKLMEERDRSA